MAHLDSPDDGLRELALFAGAGGGILGGKLLGWRTVCAVEWEPYPAAVLARRQDEGFLPPFPIWDDVQTFDGKPWRGLVDVVSGGFPCQDISAAGKGAGITGERSGMWSHMARIIGEVRPRFAFVENSPVLTSRGLGTVLGDLAAMGYDAEWGVLGANDALLDHKRDRIWIVAHDIQRGFRPMERPNFEGPKRWSSGERREGRIKFLVGDDGRTPSFRWASGTQIISEPIVCGNTDGMAPLMDRIAALGNGQVPAVVRLAWHTLHERLMSR